MCIICYPGHVFYATIGTTIGSADTGKLFAAGKLTASVTLAMCSTPLLAPQLAQQETGRAFSASKTRIAVRVI